MLYRVSGVWLVNDRPAVLCIHAASPDEARAEAARRGLKVSEVASLDPKDQDGKPGRDGEPPAGEAGG